MKLDLPTAGATEALGRALAEALPTGDTAAGCLVLLQGELGSGKTTLARALLRGLGHGGAVPSPTYTLVEPYDLPRGRIYHIDLYRLSDESELTFLGWDELDDGLRLVEWPERAPYLTRDADVRVCLSYRGEGRRAIVECRDTALERALAAALAARGHAASESR